MRDLNGRWIMGFMVNIGICTAVGAEVWAVLHGLQMAWRAGARRLIVELDSLLVIPRD